jgi:hypothetical protein
MSQRPHETGQRAAGEKQQPAAADREHMEKLLDRALADTFPASDPVSTLMPDPTPSPVPTDKRPGSK